MKLEKIMMADYPELLTAQVTQDMIGDMGKHKLLIDMYPYLNDVCYYVQIGNIIIPYMYGNSDSFNAIPPDDRSLWYGYKVIPSYRLKRERL